MLSNDLDLRHWRQQLQQRGRIQIPDVLQASALERLRACLEQEVPWGLAVRHAGDVARLLPAAEWRNGSDGEAGRVAQAAQGARGGYAFAYESYMMVTAALEGRDPGLLLHAVLDFLNAPPFLSFCRMLTGDPSLRRVSAQATRYRPGMFLRRHNDFEADEGRRYAYVFNLGRSWSADWGGLLHFQDQDGRVVETLEPMPNSLSLFKVPAWHFVSPVAPWAETDRLGITGWWLT
ncbi:MAG: 2OG-Fe(II) oxygenase [Xanthomonadales bacterium]|nr:2OG-Fe(II) oxygenase [Xanthomonadales bacterium]